MAIVIDGVEYLTPQEACALFVIHPNKIDGWYIGTKEGNLDMPYIMDPTAKSPIGGYRLRPGGRPSYLLPRKKFTEWLVKRPPRMR